jgi:hypothetical protein
VLDRIRVLGDPVQGGKRGIDFRGATEATLRNFYIDDVFQTTIDTQAIYTGTMGPGGGLVIDRGYACAAGQGFMSGGEDPATAANTPSNIRITRVRFTKKRAWMLPRDGAAVLVPGKHAQQCKCAVEFKNVKNLVMEDCDLEGAGTTAGQAAALIDATVRNQNGAAPWSTVENVRITNCRGTTAGAIVNVLGSDNQHPSGTLTGFTIEGFTATAIDPKGITGGSGRLFQFERAPIDVTLTDITVAGAHLAAAGYFIGKAPPVRLTIAGVVLPPTTYGWKIDAGKAGRAALLAYMPDAQLDETVI